MKNIIGVIIILLMGTAPAHSEWQESVKEGWDKSVQQSQKGWEKSKVYGSQAWEKSKVYGTEAWDKTKQAWDSANENFSESEETRKQSRAEQEQERFAEMWNNVFSQLEDGLEVVDDIKKAPDSAFFGEDKKSLRKDLNAVLDNTLVLLEDKSINDYRAQIERFNQLIETSRSSIAQYREDKVTAPKEHSVKTTRDDYKKKIAEEKENISLYQLEIKKITVHFKERLHDIGVDLTQDQVNILLARVDADDIIQMSVVFDVLKQITSQLMQLTQESGEDIKQAKKYYGMHVVLLELVNYMQQKYIDMVDTVYIPKIDTIIANTIKTRNNARKYISSETNAKRIASYKNNINALNLTLKTAKLYQENLKEQKHKVVAAQKVLQRDLNLSQNTYDTVEISADLLSVLKTSKDSFDALMSLQVPQIVPFENMQMQQKYQELSKLLKK